MFEGGRGATPPSPLPWDRSDLRGAIPAMSPAHPDEIKLGRGLPLPKSRRLDQTQGAVFAVIEHAVLATFGVEEEEEVVPEHLHL